MARNPQKFIHQHLCAEPTQAKATNIIIGIIGESNKQDSNVTQRTEDKNHNHRTTEPPSN